MSRRLHDLRLKSKVANRIKVNIIQSCRPLGWVGFLIGIRMIDGIFVVKNYICRIAACGYDVSPLHFFCIQYDQFLLDDLYVTART